ncbi:PD40 domain-containing protein [Pyxidicoccus parkwayensis]|uniref:PD40 domain-containing protein n=1 Tax=Pyxidicoccus parkwayensis TaxID=2813578 RepID=A0ABX7NQH0_9BACT|nr:PD40 domain-containing protein [Pyxidicoccus parkwaysis]QSQ21092.1 PD40 domain-containing protein [Pyxidicoccus parkwaysis]
MTGMRWFIGGVLAVGLLGACEPTDEGGGGTTGDVLFTQGFAFVREDDRNVYVVDDDGDPNDPQKLTTVGGVYWPAVSRDGRSIVFVQRSGTATSLRTVPTSGGTTATLFSSGDSTCPRGCTNFRTPTFSPDGRSVVFVFSTNNSSVTSLGRVNTDGSGFVELTPNTTISYGAPSFVPNGSAVVAPAGSGLRQLNQIARVPLDGTGPTFSSLGNEVLAVENRVAVSPSGTQVAFDGRLSSGSVRIYVASFGTAGVSALQRVTDLTSAGVLETWPTWTRSNQVGFLLDDASGGTPGIYRATTGTGTPSSVTLAVPSAAEPSYGPL